jgi:hypothetical protein
MLSQAPQPASFVTSLNLADEAQASGTDRISVLWRQSVVSPARLHVQLFGRLQTNLQFVKFSIQLLGRESQDIKSIRRRGFSEARVHIVSVVKENPAGSAL